MLLSDSWLPLRFSGEDDVVCFNSSLPVFEEGKKSNHLQLISNNEHDCKDTKAMFDLL